jgi:hypothetical protein
MTSRHCLGAFKTGDLKIKKKNKCSASLSFFHASKFIKKSTYLGQQVCRSEYFIWHYTSINHEK